MITCRDKLFHLSAPDCSYLLRVTPFGHLESVHFGDPVPDAAAALLAHKQSAPVGSAVVYDSADPAYSLDTLPLEWSGIGRGDYRHSPAEIKMPDGTFVCDFIYHSHSVSDGPMPMPGMPGAIGEPADCQTLSIKLEDEAAGASLMLYYTIYPGCSVITRRAELRNNHDKPLVIRRLMSMMLDLPDRGFSLISLHGGWIREGNRQEQPLAYGLSVRQSTTGASGNRHNPGIMLAGQGAGELHGPVYGFNLIYSGNHYEAVELSEGGLVRVMSGINPHCFEWTLSGGGQFETPEAVLTYSAGGFNGVSRHFHDFVNRHIVRGDWRDRERPVLFNSWEACFFNFSRRRLLKLAGQARRLGMELFVLDDGWFGKRDNDRSGLGDYRENRRKLGGSLKSLARKINRRGLLFGLWFEPEMVSPDSDLYRAHPDYAVKISGRKPVLGRHQLVLDLCNPEVRDHLVSLLRDILTQNPISYVKWDMNRHISDMHSPALANQGEFFHRYILGLYEVLKRVFGDRPDILLETCASGGNRFDLGMLCFSPQIWASDNTDPISRLEIQRGLSCFYPPSTIGAHVSASPHQQTLRRTPLATRFNVASFGCLGYELDLTQLLPAERKEIRDQIAFYKKHRRTLQFGHFYRLEGRKAQNMHWQAVARDGSESLAGFFQTRAEAGAGFDFLPLTGLEPKAEYRLTTRPQPLSLRLFGGLVNHILPVRLHPEGLLLHLAGKFLNLPDCVETYEGSGEALQAGLRLNSQFSGTGHSRSIRLLGDYGSNLYWISRIGRTNILEENTG